MTPKYALRTNYAILDPVRLLKQSDNLESDIFPYIRYTQDLQAQAFALCDF